jgi:hypothetical protein
MPAWTATTETNMADSRNGLEGDLSIPRITFAGGAMAPVGAFACAPSAPSTADVTAESLLRVMRSLPPPPKPSAVVSVPWAWETAKATLPVAPGDVWADRIAGIPVYIEETAVEAWERARKLQEEGRKVFLVLDDETSVLDADTPHVIG